MAVRMDKPWRPLEPETVAALPGQLGIYQIGDDAGQVLYVGYAGGHALFGMRSQLQAELDAPREGASRFRVEITMQYMTRYLELLMVHRADHGVLPRDNEAAPPPRLGRLSPA